MKTNILFKNTSQFLILLFIILLSTLVVGQERELDSEILVYFLPDSLELDKNVTELDDMSKLKIKSKSLDKVLKKTDFKSIKKAFPEFNESDTLKTRKDGKKIKLPNMSRIFKLKLHNKDNINSVIEMLSKEKGVLYAEKHSEMQLHTNDVQYAQQWHLNNIGQSGGTSDADIDAPEAWFVFNGSSCVKLGVIDTGVETAHDDLTGKSSGDAPESYPYNGYAHGTHVAGISGAKHGNVGEVKGVDANVQIISKKVFSGYEYNYSSQQDEPKWGGDDNAYNKIISAVNDGADVLNNSYGGSNYSSTLRMAFAYAYKNNVTSVVSMGNSWNSQTQYPAGFGQGIIAVGATDRYDVIAPYSSIGNHVDVSAPGTSILSTWRGNGYNTISGTSMAAPVVSGIATLLKGYYTNLENDDIENIIRLSVDDKGTTGWDQYYGTGRVNAKKALDYLRAPYVLEQNSVTGGSIYSSTSTYNTAFMGVSGLATSVYIVKRHEVRKTVSLNSALTDKHVWGRGVDTEGFSGASPNYGMGWCDVVSSDETSATLRTFIYQVWSISGVYLGYYPTTASNVKFEYSVLGSDIQPPSAPQNLSVVWDNRHPKLTWNSNTEPDMKEYKIWKYAAGSEMVAATITHNPSISTHTWTDNSVTPAGKLDPIITYSYKVKAVDNANNESLYSNQVSINGTGGIWKINGEEDTNEDITSYALESNYPNPFNPTTQISYQLPENSFVNLVVYNVVGQKVAELVNQEQTSGKYTVKFDASNLPSGVYIYKLQAGEFSDVKKMLLTK